MKTKRYVILVEDDPTVLHSLRLQMQQILPTHYNIETANDGNEAMEVLQDITAQGGLIPLVVTDHQMPRMTGSEFLINVRQLVPKCRNIMLTGEAGLTDITQLINEQALFRYLTKPWSQVDLEMTVLSALESFHQEFRLEKLNHELAETNANLEQLVEARTRQLQLKTQELNSGLEYAKLMQESLLPSNEDMQSFFSKVDSLFQPHSTVSGDFYSFHEASQDKAMVVVGDATGHGIAGAFLSSICLGIINDIVQNQELVNSMNVLSEILKRFKTLSAFASSTMREMVSVELTVVCVNKAENVLSYASNSKQLMLTKDQRLVNVPTETFDCCRGNDQTRIGSRNKGKVGSVGLDAIDTVILYSDGVPDQFTEETSKKLGRKGLLAALPEVKRTGAENWFENLRGKEPLIDDATLLVLEL